MKVGTLENLTGWRQRCKTKTRIDVLCRTISNHIIATAAHPRLTPSPPTPKFHVADLSCSPARQPSRPFLPIPQLLPPRRRHRPYLRPESEHVLLLSARPILDRLREVRGLDAFTPRQIGERSRQLQHPVIRSRAQVHRPASRAGIFRVAVTTARAWGLGPDPTSIKLAGKVRLPCALADREASPECSGGDGDDLIFQGLSQHFQTVLAELGHLVG